MNKTISLSLATTITASMILALTVSAVFGDNSSRKIVVFDTEALNEAAQNELVAHTGGVTLKNLDLINAKSVWLPNKASEKALEQHPAVLRVDEDVLVTTQAKPEPTVQAAQVLPWGIDRVDAELVWPSGNNADPVKVAVIDNRIFKNHPDLKANIKGGYNAINS